MLFDRVQQRKTQWELGPKQAKSGLSGHVSRAEQTWMAGTSPAMIVFFATFFLSASRRADYAFG
jgi:hypothetical protein